MNFAIYGENVYVLLFRKLVKFFVLTKLSKRNFNFPFFTAILKV
jgi:hypothetical protein